MSDFPSSQSSTAESIALIQSIRSLKQSATDRATAFGITTSIASDVMAEAARNNVTIGQSTKDRLELCKELDAEAGAAFKASSLDVDVMLSRANALLAEQAAKLQARL
jgi:poly(A) polymerase Pap1